MSFLGKIFGKKAKKEPLVEELGEENNWETEPAMVEAIQEMVEVLPSLCPPPLTEGKLKGGNGMVKEPSGRKKPNTPPPAPKLKKRKKKPTTKKGSVKKMAGEIVYEYVQCECEDWKTHLPQIVEQQQYAVNRGRREGIDMAFDMKPFVFCPWCGYKRYRSNRGKKASK